MDIQSGFEIIINEVTLKITIVELSNAPIIIIFISKALAILVF